MREIRWEGKKVDEEKVKELAKSADIPVALARVLSALNIRHKEEAEGYLTPDYLTQIHNPFDILGMQKTIKRIIRAIELGEKILIHADYDADGVTTAAVFKEAFRMLGVEVDVYVPNRFDDGYGIHERNAEKFSKKYDLVISGDTGIRAFTAASIFKNSNADLIITDHHEPVIGKVDDIKQKFGVALSDKEVIEKAKNEAVIPSDTKVEIYGNEYIVLPDAYEVIDPKRLGDQYPCKALAGVGVAFKVMQALFVEKKHPLKPLFYLLDYVATGSVADLAPQIDRKDDCHNYEVRTMSKFGLDVMNKSPKPWIKAIKDVKGLKGDVTSGNIGWNIGPLLNAPGRMEKPDIALDLLLEKDEVKAKAIAEKLEEINKERQKVTQKGVDSAKKELAAKDDEHVDFGIAIHSDKIHEGITGLVAGKIQKKYYRPTIAFAPIEQDGEVLLKGSARSIPGIHVLHMLDYVKEQIGDYKYGGHEQAAGMSIKMDQYESFRKAFREACMDHEEDIFIPLETYDAVMKLEEIDFEFINFLSRLEPHGVENAKPTFRANNIRISNLKPIMEGKGAKFVFKQDNTILNGIIFEKGEEIFSGYKEFLLKGKPCHADILFYPEINRWNGEVSIQLKIKDVKFKKSS